MITALARIGFTAFNRVCSIGHPVIYDTARVITKGSNPTKSDQSGPTPFLCGKSLKAIRGPEPGAPVLKPLHLTRVLGPPPDFYLYSLLSFFVFLYLSVCEALKLRSLPFTHPIYVASLYFQ